MSEQNLENGGNGTTENQEPDNQGTGSESVNENQKPQTLADLLKNSEAIRTEFQSAMDAQVSKGIQTYEKNQAKKAEQEKLDADEKAKQAKLEKDNPVLAELKRIADRIENLEKAKEGQSLESYQNKLSIPEKARKFCDTKEKCDSFVKDFPDMAKSLNKGADYNPEKPHADNVTLTPEQDAARKLMTNPRTKQPYTKAEYTDLVKQGDTLADFTAKKK